MDDSVADVSEHLDSSDNEEFTPGKVLQDIENAWLNEKFAPEILPHQSELVDCMLEQISHMEENMKKLKKGDIRLAIHKMEIDRIRFVIKSYLRTRLEKIEQYTIHILSEDDKKSPEESYLTPGERKFAKEYLANIETLFRTVALQHMPANFQAFEVDKLTVKPNLNSHVFLRVNKPVQGIIVPGTTNDEIDLTAGAQRLIQYQPIASLVKEGAVQLI
ncbi:DNA replication complex GINS protein SLD5 isoform X1 [Neodiprion pinetum]|uniref:DNA replication complex GINS protein SLD5 n=1 Tax=Neodiprion lecontei TaxID=441921 RepID=A0A6J0B9V5_NEOLC|nr:DNA replication complex GINS protein SLD5 isoform X1 [Neodiprion lecontei]XP_046468482.1 DNA replication complex GINS protein SLD5 isoform X1 [Neodiprion pinetum]